ncbi:MAG: nuclear transport factor 2 family protein [Caldilineaceae bacterium]|nr:nuclear transport factor 2 family protein [Caldilineaceae bacterium]
MSDNLETAKRYLQALETNADRETLAQFFDLAVIQEEFPNRLNPQGGRSDYATILERAERGKQLLVAQHYAIENSLESGNVVVLEVIWTATLAVRAPTLPADGQMRAHFALFLEFHNGKIMAQRNYDCFDPW